MQANSHSTHGYRSKEIYANNVSNKVTNLSYNRDNSSREGRQYGNFSGNRQNYNNYHNQDTYRPDQRGQHGNHSQTYRTSNFRQQDSKNGRKSTKNFRGKNIFIGSGTNNSALSRAPRRFHYSVSKLRPETDAETLRQFIAGFIQCDTGNIEVEEIKLKHSSYYRMFRVTIGEEHASVMQDGSNWPCGIEVKRFYLPRDVESGTLNKTSANNSVAIILPGVLSASEYIQMESEVSEPQVNTNLLN